MLTIYHALLQAFQSSQPLRDKYCYYSDFIDEETEIQKNGVTQGSSTELLVSRSGVCTLNPQLLCVFETQVLFHTLYLILYIFSVRMNLKYLCPFLIEKLNTSHF